MDNHHTVFRVCGRNLFLSPREGIGLGKASWRGAAGKKAVLGACIAVAAVPSATQCAEMQRMADGAGIACAIFFQPEENSFFSIAFMGEPWPMKRTGISMV